MFRNHHQLYQFGTQKQAQLHSSTVVILGCGGLGCIVAMHLASSGVGHLVLVDYDKVEESNLHRQLSYVKQDIGSYKANVLKEWCIQHQPGITITTVVEACSDTNIHTIIHQGDKPVHAVVDCMDSARTKVMVNLYCKRLGIPYIFGSAVAWDGQVCTMMPHHPCLNCIFPSYEVGSDSCELRGVLGPIPCVIGSLQAVECIKVLTKLHPDIQNQHTTLVNYSGWDNTFEHMECTTCDSCSYCYPNNRVENKVTSTFEQEYPIEISYAEYLVQKQTKDVTLLLDIRLQPTEEQQLIQTKR